MSETPPILAYTTPAPRPRFWALSAIILIIWGIIDILAGFAGAVMAGAALLLAPDMWYVISLPFLAAIVVLYYGGQSCQLGNRILHQDASSLRRAILMTLIAEVIAWIAILTILAFAAHDRHWVTKPRLSEIALDSLALLFPASITATRLLLRHAARFSLARASPPSDLNN